MAWAPATADPDRDRSRGCGKRVGRGEVLEARLGAEVDEAAVDPQAEAIVHAGERDRVGPRAAEPGLLGGELDRDVAGHRRLGEGRHAGGGVDLALVLADPFEELQDEGRPRVDRRQLDLEVHRQVVDPVAPSSRLDGDMPSLKGRGP